MSGFSATQGSVPSHLSKWPDVKVSAPPNSQPVAKPTKKVFKNESGGEDSDGSNITKEGGKKSNSFDGAGETSSSGTETESEYDSAEEAPTEPPKEAVKEGAAEDDSKKAEGAAGDDNDSDSSSSSDTASEDEESNDSDDEKATEPTKEDNKQSTPSSDRRRLSISSKEKLKTAVAEKHDENKRKGVKSSVEGNVFNARSPAITTATPAKPASADQASKKQKESNSMKPPATAPVPRLRTERSDAPPPSSPLRKKVSQPKDADSIQVPVTAGPNPPVPKWNRPGKEADKLNAANAKVAPQSGKRDSSGHLVFSSAAISKDSSPEPEAEKTKPVTKQRKKKEAELTGADAVLAEAKKQAARLQEHKRLKQIKQAELLSPPEPIQSNAEPSSGGSGDHSSNEDGHSHSNSSSETSVEKPPESTRQSKKSKDGCGDDETKHAKKQKQKDTNEHSNDLPTPQSSKKSKKRKRDTKTQDHESDTAVDADASNKAKKKQTENDRQENAASEVVEGQTSDKKSKKKEKKRKSAVQPEDANDSANNEPAKSPKQTNSTDEQQIDSTDKSPPKKKLKKDKKKEQSSEDIADVHPSRQSQVKSEATNGNNTTRKPLNSSEASTSVAREPSTPAPVDTTNPDITSLLTHLKLLIPRSTLETAQSKLNSDNKESCSKRKSHHLQKSKSTNKKAKTKQEASNIDSSAVDYSLNDDVTVLAAARDLLVSLSGKRMGMDLLNDEARSQSAVNMSPMELELGRIAMERQWENERLQEQVRNLEVRIQRLQG